PRSSEVVPPARPEPREEWRVLARTSWEAIGELARLVPRPEPGGLAPGRHDGLADFERQAADRAAQPASHSQQDEPPLVEHVRVAPAAHPALPYICLVSETASDEKEEGHGNPRHLWQW